MKDAFAYEISRIRTIRSTWWLSLIAFVAGVGITALFCWGIHHNINQHPLGPQDRHSLGSAIVTQLAASGQIPSIVGFLLAIIGIFAWGHEYRHGMVRASLTALSSRTSFWVAKYVVCAVWVAVVAVVTMLASAVVGSIWLGHYINVWDGLTWSIIGRETGYDVILVFIAMAFTSITRSQAFALVALFIWPLLIENLIHLFFVLVPSLQAHQDILRFLPFGAGDHMVDVISTPASTFGDPLSPLGGTIVFGALGLVLTVASYVLFRRRDA